jgi:hypothetical protein
MGRKLQLENRENDRGEREEKYLKEGTKVRQRKVDGKLK